jgi:hypothetical protein
MKGVIVAFGSRDSVRYCLDGESARRVLEIATDVKGKRLPITLQLSHVSGGGVGVILIIGDHTVELSGKQHVC